jgi:hypothetical protein
MPFRSSSISLNSTGCSLSNPIIQGSESLGSDLCGCLDWILMLAARSLDPNHCEVLKFGIYSSVSMRIWSLRWATLRRID